GPGQQASRQPEGGRAMTLMGSLVVMLPELVIALGAMALLLVGAIGGEKTAGLVSWAAILVMVLAELAVATGYGGHAFAGAFVSDDFARFAKLLILIGAALSVLLAEAFFSTIARS